MDITILASKFYEYSTFIRGYSPETIKRYKNIIRYYCLFAHIETIEQVNEANVRALFYHGRTERNWQSYSFITYPRSLMVFFRWCKEQGYIVKNPVEDIEMPKLEKRLPKKLTKQEALKLIEVVYNYPYGYRYLRYRNHAIFATFIFAGLRKSELLRLRLTDVDIENQSIFVNQGKGSKDRVVPMSHTLAQSLKKYLDERKRLNKTCPQFFCALNRNMGFSDSAIRKLVDQMRKATGTKFTIHKLRHTFATLMLEGGCDIYSLSKMMGHSDIKTTTIYLSASAEHLRLQMTKHPMNDL
jgi:site-specific recombinase XerD